MPEFPRPQSTTAHHKLLDNVNYSGTGYVVGVNGSATTKQHQRNYANQSIPFVKKVPGGEAAYEQALMKRSFQK